MSNYIRGEGNANAKLMIIGDYPSYYDDLSSTPFVSSSPIGRELDNLLYLNGLSRSEVYLTNFLKYRIPDNDYKRRRETNPSDTISLENLCKEINAIKPNCILLTGERILQNLCGLEKKMKHYRGSVIKSNIIESKILPTYNPNIYLHEKDNNSQSSFKYIWKYIIQLDFAKAVKESQTSRIDKPYRLLTIAKYYEDVVKFFEDEIKGSQYLSIDIESRNCFPFCIGFSASKDRAISVPLFTAIGDNQFSTFNTRELARIWRYLACILPKFETIGQNLKYDQDKLEKLGFTLGPLYIDTLLLGHTLCPEYPIKKLEFWTSLYTREPYYKDEGSGYHPLKDKIDRILLYNARDAAVTYEIAMAMKQEAIEDGKWEYYYKYKRPLHEWYLRIENRGFRVDRRQRRKVYKKYRLLEEINNKRLESILGRNINICSNPQVSEAVYGTMGLPYRKGAGEEVLVSLIANTKNIKPIQIEFLEAILDGRRIKKTIRTYIKAKPDFDERMRTSFNIVGTVTGRSSTRKLKPPIRPLYPTGTKKKGKPIGLGFHQLTKHGKLGPDIRSLLVPDEGKVLWEVDKKQAEAYVVFLLSEDYDMLEKLKDPNFDIHTWTTQLVLELPYEEAKKTEPRFIGKTVRHMCGYDAHKHKVMLEINTNAKRFGIKVSISEWKAGKYLDKFHQFSPKIRQTFHPEIKRALEENNRTLTTPFGLPVTFHERWDDELFRLAYAYIPQNFVPDSVRIAAINLQNVYHKDLEIIVEAHDALIGQCYPDEARQVCEAVETEFTKPFSFEQCTLKRGMLSIPAESTIYLKSYDPAKTNAIPLSKYEVVNV